MKLLASGDHHFDEHSRFDECIRIHQWIADRVAEERPDVFLSGGDIYERASTPKERAAVADWLTAVAEICPVVITKGNHEKKTDLLLLARLETRHPIIVEEAAGVHVDGLGGFAVGCVAWPNRASLAAMLGKPMTGEALDEAARDCLQVVLRDLGAQLAQWNGPRILLGHFMIDGSVTSTGQPLIGAELNVGLADLALAGAELTIAAHIHKPQEWEFNGKPIVYTGSSYRTAFGETEEKSILLAEFDSQKLLYWKRLSTPATPMLLLTGLFGNGQLILIEQDVDPKGAEIRFRYSVDTDHREPAKRAACELRDRFLAAGALSVKLDEVVQSTTRARAPEVAQASSLSEKLSALWQAKNDEPTPERKTRLLGRLGQLEEEVRAA